MFFIASLILFFLVLTLVWMRRRTMKLSRPLSYGILGGFLGYGISMTLYYVECLGNPNAFCGAFTMTTLGPILSIAGAITGVAIGYKRRNK